MSKRPKQKSKIELISPANSINNIQKIIKESHDNSHPVSDLIFKLVEKNRGATPSSHIVDYELLTIDLRYAISQISKVANKLENVFRNY